MDLTKLVAFKERYVFYWVGRAGVSEGRFISKSEHQKGRAILISELFKGRVTHRFQNFFNGDFCDDAFHFSYRLSLSFHLL